MKAPFRSGFKVLWRFFCSWQLAAGLGVLLLIGLALWVWPRRSAWVVSADGRHEWPAGESPPPRQVLWETPQRIDNLLPQFKGKGSFITPRLADNGATLYFCFRPHGGQADIYRSQFEGGQWQPAEAVAELNSPADDIGPVLTRAGRELYFYSNRPGGMGGTDLYVSKRTGSAWGAPKNLGPQVNSPAQEYDPALGPDGLTLFFSSNRSPDMSRQAAAAASTKADPWATTLRSHPGLPQFDLYRARRTAPDEAWSVPEALVDLNLPNANQGAPFVSPSGDFLYFASDRPARRGEPVNLDLYRARWLGDRFVDIENLGPGINTSAHETEPGLSPEGFTLVFSSDRDMTYGLYQSTAQEVFARTEWDSSRLQALSAVWWKILLATFLLSVLAALLAYYRGWLLAKASAARFVLASLLLHLFFLFLLGVVPLAYEVAERAELIRLADVPAQIFHSDTNRQQAAYEKVADLGAVASAAVPELDRQATPLPQAPEPSLVPAPDVPVPVPKFLPKQVPLEKTPVPENQAVDLVRKAPSLKVVEVDPAAPQLAPAMTKLKERPLAEANVRLSRREIAPLPSPNLEPPSPQREDSVRPTIAKLKTVPQKLAEPLLPDIAPVLAGKRQADRPPKVVEELPRLEMAAKPVAATPTQLEPAAASVTVERSNTANTLDKALVPSPSSAKNAKLEPVFSLPGVIPQAKPARELAGNGPLPDPLAGMRSMKKPKVVEDVAAAEAAVAVPPASESAAEKPVAEAGITLPRAKALLPDPLLTSGKPVTSSPSSTDMKPNWPSRLGNSSVRDQPGLSPVEARLTRKNAGGSHLAQPKHLLDLPPVYALRIQETRKKAIAKLGGSTASEAAVERGLDWLAVHQHLDGHWSLNQYHANCKHPQCAAGAAAIAADAAGTGLGLLPFLGAGYTHKSGKHQASVARALDWLIKHQRPDGALMGTGEYRLMYGHGLAAIALCEAYGMTRDPRLREPAQKALDFITRAQHAPSGGWRYAPNTPGDTSVLGWQVMALKSGEIAGLSVPPKTWEGARRWLASVQANPPAGGLFGYLGPAPTPAMTAQGLLCLQLMGARRDDPRLVAGANYLLQHLPRKGADTSYYWYHAIQVTYAMGGKHWRAWNEPLRDMLVATQLTQGPLAGTWDPLDARERTGGRICATALRLLMLEVYYRRLPLYRQLEQ